MTRERMREFLNQMNIDSDRTLPLFERYYSLLREWNEKFNLTAVTQREEVYRRHFKDSLLGLPYLCGKKILDVGSGAGFPALPLAIADESLDVWMIDSLNKRVTFLTAVIAELGLKNARALHVRAEDFTGRESFDTVTARAVAPLNVLAEYCLPFVRIGGIMLAYKASGSGEEQKQAARAVQILGGKIERTEQVNLDSETVRDFIVIRKQSATPKAYPRRGNKPKTNPL